MRSSVAEYGGALFLLVLAATASAQRAPALPPLADPPQPYLSGKFVWSDLVTSKFDIAQAEARWRLAERWGVVAFAGGGEITRSLTGRHEKDLIPSYGLGLRFMVSPAQRINMRLDYGRSRDSDAVYLSVLEAF